MPQNPSKEEPKPEVTVVPSEIIDSTKNQQVVIDATTGKAAENTSSSFDTSEIERKLSSKLFYELRQMEKRNKEMLEQLSQNIQSKPAKAERSDELVDELDEIAERDWKKAVSMLAEKEADKKLKAYQEQQKNVDEERRIRETYLSMEEKSKQKVLREFPDLLDENSDTFKKYMEVFNREVMEDPSFMNNPRKHEIVASEIRGYVPRQVQNPEVERLKRVAAGSSTPTRNVQSGNRIIMTQEEIDLCDKSGIPYNVYARNKQRVSDGTYKEGLEIQP